MQSKDVFPHANKNIKILDAGAGTGIIGEMLVKQGYTNIDGLDISQKMLDILRVSTVNQIVSYLMDLISKETT